MDRTSSSLLINESPMQFLPSLGIVLDNNNKAIFLQQLQYLLNISNVVINNKKYVYNTFAEWNMMFPMFSVRTIKRMVEEFKTLNLDGEIYHIIKTKKVNCGVINYKMYYTIDYDEMARLEEKAKIKKAYKRREIVLDTPHMLFNYQRYANQYPNELPESIMDLLKWAVKNEVKISESWQKSDEGKELMEELEKAKCQRSTHEMPVCHSASEAPVDNSHQALNNNESDNLAPQECYADTAGCLQDTNGVQAQHLESATVTLPTILSKTYTKKYNIDLKTEEDISSSGGNARTRNLPSRMEITEEELSYLPQPIQEVIAFYDKNINPAIPATPFEKEMLVKYCHETSPEWVIEAIKQALLNGKAHLGYIQGILHNWQEYGFGVMSVNKQNTSKAYKNVNRNKSGNASAEELQKGVLSRLKEMGMY